MRVVRVVDSSRRVARPLRAVAYRSTRRSRRSRALREPHPRAASRSRGVRRVRPFVPRVPVVVRPRVRSPRQPDAARVRGVLGDRFAPLPAADRFTGLRRRASRSRGQVRSGWRIAAAERWKRRRRRQKRRKRPLASVGPTALSSLDAATVAPRLAATLPTERSAPEGPAGPESAADDPFEASSAAAGEARDAADFGAAEDPAERGRAVTPLDAAADPSERPAAESPDNPATDPPSDAPPDRSFTALDAAAADPPDDAASGEHALAAGGAPAVEAVAVAA